MKSCCANAADINVNDDIYKKFVTRYNTVNIAYTFKFGDSTHCSSLGDNRKNAVEKIDNPTQVKLRVKSGGLSLQSDAVIDVKAVDSAIRDGTII